MSNTLYFLNKVVCMYMMIVYIIGKCIGDIGNTRIFFCENIFIIHIILTLNNYITLIFRVYHINSNDKFSYINNIMDIILVNYNIIFLFSPLSDDFN